MTKKNGTIIWKMSIIVSILLALGSVIWGFASQSGRLDRNVIDTNSVTKTATENRMELVGVKKDIGYLSEKIDRNYTVQQQILDEIKELH